ncbi:MAG: thiamine-phosphate synthase family protein, partial [Promethearchaeota archaeon]
IYEFIREKQPDKIRNKEKSTMQYLINECYRKYGCIPDIIWDKGAIGKEPMIRLFGKDSKNIIYKLEKIIDAIKS